jgi:glyceraldehyde-3-phosphate dehydrogenase (NADP+)
MLQRTAIESIFPTEAEVPARFRINPPCYQTEYLIEGELRDWRGPPVEVRSGMCVRGPAGLEYKVIGSCPSMTEREALEALDAAVQAYENGRGAWPTMSVERRISHVEQFAHRMVEKRDEVVRLMMWEIGKSLHDSTREFDRTVAYIRDTIEAVKELDRAGSRFTIADGIFAQIRRAPLGVVLCMGPYNYPLNETYTLLIPALIMGNTVVFKPPRIGALLHRPLLQAFRDSFPPGVVNTVYGRGSVVTTPLMASGKVDVLAFIGGSKAADALKKAHPRPHRLRSVLGLEAKNAAIVLADADLDLAVGECVLGAVSFNGQRCTALKMLWVHADIAERFLARLGEAIAALKIGMPWDEGVNLTPMPTADEVRRQSEFVQDALANGARVVNAHGGTIVETFFYPAVLFPVNRQMKLYHEEQFGPTIPVASFTDIQEPIRYIVDSNYGQQASVFGSDPDVIAGLIDPLVNQVCRLNLNSQCQRGPDTFPFTGRKDSAEGTLSVSDALRVFTLRTLVAAKGNDLNKRLVTEIVRERKSSWLSTDFVL